MILMMMMVVVMVMVELMMTVQRLGLAVVVHGRGIAGGIVLSIAIVILWLAIGRGVLLLLLLEQLLLLLLMQMMMAVAVRLVMKAGGGCHGGHVVWIQIEVSGKTGWHQAAAHTFRWRRLVRCIILIRRLWRRIAFAFTFYVIQIQSWRRIG